MMPQITQSLLNGNWYQHTDLTFRPGPSPIAGHVDIVTPLVQKFLAIVDSLAKEYVKELSRTPNPRATHYEDFFSLAYQASRPEVEHTPNLAVVEFLRRLRKETDFLHRNFSKGTQGGYGFSGLAESACDFVHWVVHHELTSRPDMPIGLTAITDVANQVDELDIFSLNHDLLIEAQCRAQGIAYEDGFAERRGALLTFNFWQTHRREKVRLFKLHGSVNWYLYEFPDFPGRVRQYAIPDKDAFNSHDQYGNPVNPVEWKAAFLSGTIVKEQLYGIGFFGELFTQFRRHLAEHNHLIFCGYGFGDPGINNRLDQWLNDRLDGSNRIVVLHGGTEPEFFADKPFWLQELKAKGRLILVNRWLEGCTLADLSPFFDN